MFAIETEDLVHPVVFPNRAIALQKPRVDAELACLDRKTELQRSSLEVFRGLLELANEEALMKKLRRLACEGLECPLLLRRQGSRLLIDHTQRPEHMAMLAEDGRASIEADARVTGHERIVSEALILQGVFHDKHLCRA